MVLMEVEMLFDVVARDWGKSGVRLLVGVTGHG